MRLAWLLLALAISLGAQKRVIVAANGPKPIGPYSPGIMAGDFLYVSGQGARAQDGQPPASFEMAARQTLDNVKAIVEAAGLTMEHVVYMQIYLADTANYTAVNSVMGQYFPHNPPARATLGVNHMPTDTPVEINAVVFRDLARRKVIMPAGCRGAAGRFARHTGRQSPLYFRISGARRESGKIPDEPAAQVQMALDRFRLVLKAAGMDFANVVFVNPYLTKNMPTDVMNQVYAKHFEFGNTPARATIQVASLPLGANIEFTGVAIADLSKRRAVRPKNMPPSPTASPCVWADDTYFCSAKSAFIPGPHAGIYSADVETQVRQTMRNLLDGLEEAGLDFSNVVASNVYLDTLDEFTKMNGVYGQYFESAPPTRTTVSPLPPVERTRAASGTYPMVEQISIVGWRGNNVRRW